MPLVNADRAASRLARLSPRVVAAVRRATEATALSIVSDARRNAPKDTTRLTNSIHMADPGGDAYSYVSSEGSHDGSLRTPSTDTDTRTDRVVGTNVEYARRQEFGFAGADRLGRVYDQPGRHYMARAADANRAEHTRRVERALVRAAKGV